MVKAKQEHDCDNLIWHVKLINDLFNGKFNPSTANPYREIVLEKLTGELRADKLDTGMKLIGQSLARMFGKKLKKRKKKKDLDSGDTKLE
jgi:hypothetical protein